MINLDISATTFYKKGPLKNYISAILRKDDEGLKRVTKIDFESSKCINSIIRNVQIEVTHIKGQRRKFRIRKLADKNASRLEFEKDGVKITVKDHFANTYGYVLKYPNLECVEMTNKCFFPIEVCEVIAGQRYSGALLPEETAKMVKETICPPKNRFEQIKYIFDERAKYSADTYLKEFGFNVIRNPLRLEGRQLEAPTIQYHERSTGPPVRPFKGSWNMMNKKVLNGVNVQSWALLNFSNRFNRNTLEDFAKAFLTIGSKQGMGFGTCKNVSSEKIDRDLELLDKHMECILQNLKQRFQISLVVVITPGSKDLYRSLKQACIKLNVVSQFVLEKNANTKPALISNLLLKINAKLGGTNNALTAGQMPSLMAGNIMVIGADVTHPSPTKDIPCSLASVVGSLDREFSTYEVVTRAQVNETDSKTCREVIVDMDKIMLELLTAYRSRNRSIPVQIVIFRDGVSDGEFPYVQDEEVEKVKAACRSFDKSYNPKITYIVIQKRHHVRTELYDYRDGYDKGNPPPGTVVDTVITHPLNYDFFLYGHYGLQGTSRPAYLTVVRDDGGIKPNDLHKMCYYLCHMYARCTKSISSPAPARYADQAAKMARQILLHQRPNEKSGDWDQKPTKAELAKINLLLKNVKFQHIV